MVNKNTDLRKDFFKFWNSKEGIVKFDDVWSWFESKLEEREKEAFERGRRDVFNAIKIMGRRDEGLFILKAKLVDEIEKQLKSQK